MNDPNSITTAVVASLRAKLGTTVKSIEPHTGVFDKTEMARYGSNVPAVRVAITGFRALGRASSGECTVPMNFAAVCIARDTATAGIGKIDRRTAVQALAAAVTLVIDKNQFGVSGVMMPEELRATNQFSPDADEQNLAVWQVLWTSRVLMGEAVDETLAALSTLYVNAVAFSGPGVDPGADPVADRPAEPAP